MPKMNQKKMQQMISMKKTVFVSTKNRDYLRNIQEIDFLKENSLHCTVIAYEDKSYTKRIIKVWLKMLNVIFSKNTEVLFIGFAPQLVFFFLPFISKKKLVVVDFFISFYDTLVDDRKKLKENSIVARFVHWVDKYVLKKADLVISDTKAHRDYFIEEFQIDANKFLVWYLEADTEIFFRRKSNRKVANQFEVLYFGSILPVQGVDIILKAAQIIQDDKEIHLTLIGPVSKEGVEEKKYPNITFIPWLTQEQLSIEIAHADLCLAGHFNGDVGKADRTIAGKTYIYKAMGKPVVLGDSLANHELFEENKMNYYVKRGDPQALADKIRELKANLYKK